MPTKWTTSLKLPSDFNAGDYRLEMRAIPPLKNGLPLRFADKEQQADGCLVLGKFSVLIGK